ncbi:SRPBCC family protein, partial [Helicobacter bizzozeronii]|uniref:SRPBCC family protein n=1 Tax=Helicobacter bizzozeronii TaxID=56877 RepID=UPI00255562F9
MTSTAAPARKVSVSRVIAADPATIFDVLADPAQHAAIDGSGTVRHSRGNPERLHLGATFSMDMKMGVPYFVKNKVVEFDEGRLIAWQHFGKHRWRYELEPVEGGTRVTETFDWSTARSPWFIEKMGYPEKHPAN